MASLDPLFGIHAESLRLRSQQLDTIAGNLANADTPGFKAKDVDFQAVLEQASTQNALTTSAEPTLTLRTPLQPSLDGNTVDVPTEQAAFAQSALKYQASLSFVEARVRALMTAITGE